MLLEDVCDDRLYVGWLLGPEDVSRTPTAILESVTAHTPSVSQHDGNEALTGPRDAVQSMRSAFARRRDSQFDRIAAIDRAICVKSEGAFYVYLDLSTVCQSSLEMAETLNTGYGAVTAPCSGCGDAGRGAFARALPTACLDSNRGWTGLHPSLPTTGEEVHQSAAGWSRGGYSDDSTHPWWNAGAVWVASRD